MRLLQVFFKKHKPNLIWLGSFQGYDQDEWDSDFDDNDDQQAMPPPSGELKVY